MDGWHCATTTIMELTKRTWLCYQTFAPWAPGARGASKRVERNVRLTGRVTLDSPTLSTSGHRVKSGLTLLSRTCTIIIRYAYANVIG